MLEWFDALIWEKQIFYGIGLLSLLVVSIQLFLLMIGVGADAVDIEIGTDHHDHGSGLGIFSINTITAFFLGFGWAGVICLNAELSMGLTLFFSVLSGVSLMIAMYFILRTMLSLQASGTMQHKSAVGEVGTVYTTIYAGGEKAGQVEVMISGRLSTAEARTRADSDLKPGAKVRITEMAGSTSFYVEPLETNTND